METASDPRVCCGVTFKSASSRIFHDRRKHGIRCRCFVCGRVFNDGQVLQEHLDAADHNVYPDSAGPQPTLANRPQQHKQPTQSSEPSKPTKPSKPSKPATAVKRRDPFLVALLKEKKPVARRANAVKPAAGDRRPKNASPTPPSVSDDITKDDEDDGRLFGCDEDEGRGDAIKRKRIRPERKTRGGQAVREREEKKRRKHHDEEEEEEDGGANASKRLRYDHDDAEDTNDPGAAAAKAEAGKVTLVGYGDYQ